MTTISIDPFADVEIPYDTGEGYIYLLHFDPPYEHAQHYRGWAAGKAFLYRRIEQHLSGQGSPLVHAAVMAGCRIIVSKVICGDRNMERRLKNQGSAKRNCPHPDCRGW